MTAADSRRLRGEDGVTLVELLTAMMVSSVVLAFIAGTVISALAAQRRQTAQVAALNEAKLAFERVTRDIRGADPLQVAALDRIRLDVQTEDATIRTVTYERVGNGLVATDAATGQARALLGDLAPGQPLFLFHLVDGSTDTAALDPRSVESVTFRLQVEPPGAGRVVDLVNRVVLRNAALVLMNPIRSERGSLPMVMLATLMVGSLVTVLVGTVVVGQRQTRFDQGFEQSLQIAETGLERMVSLIESRQKTASFTLDVPPGARYSGSADLDGRKWTLTATGTVDRPCQPGSTPCETSRTLTLTIRVESLFNVAGFGRTLVELRGSNSSDSYRSGTFTASSLFSLLANGSSICAGLFAADPFSSSDSNGTRMCSPTGNGVVATNQELYLLGQVMDNVDRAEIHYARENVTSPLPGATGFCGGVTAACTSSKLRYFVDPIELEPDPVVPPADLPNQGSFTGSVLPAGRQLYTNINLDSATQVQGTPGNPSIVYLTGTLTVPNGAVVNFESSNGNWAPKPSPGLLIFSAGVGPALRFGNHASFSGAVYAPRATFSGGAAGNIYGSMVTGSISTQGGWNFHYDEALGDVDAEARFVTSGWAER